MKENLVLKKTYQEKELAQIFCKELSILLDAPCILLLSGDLGAGKTTFMQEYAKKLGISEPITSPTYTYVNTYKTKDGKSLAHFDLYRLKDIEGFSALGFEEYFTGMYDFCIVEWPDRAQSFLDTLSRYHIILEHASVSTRHLTLFKNEV